MVNHFQELEERLLETYGSRSLYDALGVRPNATQEEITSKYRGKARKYHPDVNPQGEKRMKDVNAIYEVLSKPEARSSYDQFLQYRVTPQQTAKPENTQHKAGYTSSVTSQPTYNSGQRTYNDPTLWQWARDIMGGEKSIADFEKCNGKDKERLDALIKLCSEILSEQNRALKNLHLY